MDIFSYESARRIGGQNVLLKIDQRNIDAGRSL